VFRLGRVVGPSVLDVLNVLDFPIPIPTRVLFSEVDWGSVRNTWDVRDVRDGLLFVISSGVRGVGGVLLLPVSNSSRSTNSTPRLLRHTT
jgi:hypothetical protein